MSANFSFEQFMSMKRSEIDHLFDSCSKVKWSQLDQREFAGINHLKLTKLLTIHKFKKGFYESEGKLWGYNIRIRQGDGYKTFQPEQNTKGVVKHGFFEVICSNSNCLLVYKNGKNPWFDPSKFLVDELVEYGDFFIGKAYAFNFFLTYFCLRK